MSPWKPCKRRDFIQRLRRLGFEGPFAGTRHQFMVFKEHRLAIPSNPEYSMPQVRMMVAEIAEIIGRQLGPTEWDRL